MKLVLTAGVIAGLVLASPALAAPTVTVRVEGASSTLANAHVTTSTQPVVHAGHNCSGTSVLGALDDATGGNWDGTYFDAFQDFLVGTIMGETPPDPDFWTLWVNHHTTDTGVCGTPLQEGDSVLFVVDQCNDFANNACQDQVLPLGLTAPAAAVQGSSAQLTVLAYKPDGTPEPVAGATVGGATTDAAGHATVGFPQAGAVQLKAAKPGFARSETETVTVSAPGAAPTPLATRDRTPPSGGLTGIADHAMLRTGPRVLRGSFGADPSGIAEVKLRLTKRFAGACSYYSGKLERFRRARCGQGAYFKIGDRADWSYLLPARLRPGRYVLDAVAVDGAGNRTPLARGATRVVFQVR